MEKSNTFEPIQIESKDIAIRPLLNKDFEKFDDIHNDILELFSCEETTKYMTHLRTNSIDRIISTVISIIGKHQRRETLFHFIFDKNKDNKIIGYFQIMPPQFVKEKYRLKQYNWMIEYMLNKNYWGKKIMTGILQAMLIKIVEQGVIPISAMVMKNNHASIRLLEKSFFLLDYECSEDQCVYTFNGLNLIEKELKKGIKK